MEIFLMGEKIIKSIFLLVDCHKSMPFGLSHFTERKTIFFTITHSKYLQLAIAQKDSCMTAMADLLFV